MGLLDGLYAHRDSIDVITCRHEAGAANMAEAYGKLIGQPGLAAVTRGPGATQASVGVHTAFQDSTPMVLFVGQVARNMRDREAFQEVDFRAMFSPLAKAVVEIDDPSRIPEYMIRVWALALEGRPGPVVVSLPEDMLSETAVTDDLIAPKPAEPAPAPSAIDDVTQALNSAQRPVLILGGPGWSAQTVALAQMVAERHGLPVATTFRRQDLFDNAHDQFVGTLGIGPVPELFQAVRNDADLLIIIGARMGEMTTGGYTLLDSPEPRARLVHVHPAADEISRVYRADIPIASTAHQFLDRLASMPASQPQNGWVEALRKAYLAHRTPTARPTALNLASAMAHLSDAMPNDAIITNGAGNYAAWIHRYFEYRNFPTQVAPTSGAMGYGVPAAIAAKLVHPDREVVGIAGDGCFMMSANELATARHHNVPVIWIVVNNGTYGTIRMHQERHHPRRVIGTDLTNPDFVAYAGAFGIPGEAVDKTDDFPSAIARARASKSGYLIELRTNPDVISPSETLTEIISRA